MNCLHAELIQQRILLPAVYASNDGRPGIQSASLQLEWTFFVDRFVGFQFALKHCCSTAGLLDT